MRRLALVCLCALGAAAASGAALREVPLLNVALTDAKGVTTSLAGFHLLSGEYRFQGYLGSASIEVGYDRLREVRVRAPAEPGGRMRATLLLRTGRRLDATFDEREGDLLLTGFATYGRVTIFFRDIRVLRLLGRTHRGDLPDYGPPAAGVDVRLRDRHGVVTELIGFRCPAGEDVIPGTRGSASIAVPLRVLRHLAISPPATGPGLVAEAVLVDGSELAFEIPTHAEHTLYGGEAEFGSFRIHILEVREVVVHRITPPLRDLDPLAAVAEDEATEGHPTR